MKGQQESPAKSEQQHRYSQVYGLMNSMYYLEEGKPLNERFIRLQGYVKSQSQTMLDDELQQTLESQIQINSFWAWMMLFLAVTLAACIPCWIMSGKMEFFTKNGWRFIVITFFMIPFLMYEQRTVKKQSEKLYNFLNVEKLKPIFISTINFSIWFGFLIYACKFTSMNHALALSSLRFFLVALIKMRKGQKIHEFQIAGCILTFIGIVMLCTDSVTLPKIYDHQTRRYLKMDHWKRIVIGDGCALISSVCSVYLDQNMKVPGMPRFTYMFFYNLFNAVNLITFGYFFGGTQFDFHTQYGIYGMFTYKNFIQVCYVGIIMGFLMMMIHILVAQIFNELVINIATCFKVIISSMFMQVLDLELIMSGLTPLGYCLICPGMVFIVGGQASLSNKQNKLAFQIYKAPDLFCPKLYGQDNKSEPSIAALQALQHDKQAHHQKHQKNAQFNIKVQESIQNKTKQSKHDKKQ